MLCHDIDTHHVNNAPNLSTMLNVSYHIISVVFFETCSLGFGLGLAHTFTGSICHTPSGGGIDTPGSLTH